MLRGGGGVTFTRRVLGMETANNNNLLSAVLFLFVDLWVDGWAVDVGRYFCNWLNLLVIPLDNTVITVIGSWGSISIIGLCQYSLIQFPSVLVALVGA